MRNTYGPILKIFHILILAAYCQEEGNIFKSLEAEKVKLKQQINEAIEDSLLTLHKNNVSEAAEGISYLNKLKNQFLQGNSTEIFSSNTSNSNNDKSTTNNVTKNIDINSSVSAGLRRAHYTYPHKTTKRDKMFNPQALFEKVPKEKYAEMLGNRIMLEHKLEEWLAKRKKEKDLIKAYREKKKRLLLGGQIEKCPRFGLGTRKAKKKEVFRRKMDKTKANDSSSLELNLDEIDIARQKRMAKVKYPCCRKCCKRSYLGCL